MEQRVDEFAVYRLDRWNARYERGGQRVTIPVEASADGSILSVYVGDVAYWDAPDDALALTDADREAIRREFTAFYGERGTQVEFDPER